MINFSGVALRRGRRLLFENASFSIGQGDRVGVTGENGAGKSSLFAMVLGTLEPEAGEISMPANLAIAHVAQETPAGLSPALEFVMDGDVELRSIQAALAVADAAHDGAESARLHARFETIGGYDAPARAARLMRGLGFAPGDEARPVAEFSGGWRMRLNLAHALMCRSDLLLLDEPTNHLDLDAVIWLQDWLSRYQGTLLLISHDRDFLDELVTRVLHVENQSLNLYTGNYSAFERYRVETLAQQKAAFERQQREVARIQSFVDRFRAKATKARQVQSRIKALERMELIAQAQVDSPFHFKLAEPEKLPSPLLKIEEAAVGYGATPTLTGVGMVLNPGDRIGLLGPNGAGKSTFIKLLAGMLPALSGERLAAQDLRIGYFAQHQLEQLRVDESALRHLQRLDPKATEKDLRGFLGAFGFSGDRALESIEPFSGGEKARLALALIFYQRPNLLLLDEPTNHLDLAARDALAMALQEFSGALVVVSHDRHLLRSIADDYWLVVDGNAAEFAGDLDDYRQWLSRWRAARDNEPDGNRPAATSRKDQRRSDAERRRLLRPFQQKVDQWESLLTSLGNDKADLERRLADPALYAESAKAELQSSLLAKAKLDKQMAEAEAAWLEASENLEAAMADLGNA